MWRMCAFNQKPFGDSSCIKKDKMENYTRVSPYVFVCHSYLAVRTRMLLVCY